MIHTTQLMKVNRRQRLAVKGLTKFAVIGLAAFTVLFGVSATSHAASFACDKAQSTTEHQICQQSVLNDADVKMATTYHILRHLVPMGTRSMIQDEQVKWLALRDQCQENIPCLKQVYQMRQQKLDLHMERIYQQGPF